MKNDVKNRTYRILILIATPKLAQRAGELFRRASVPIQFEIAAHGTASSEIMDLLGLGSIDKTVLLGAMPKPAADRGLKRLHRELHLDTQNSGIAFTVPISGASSLLLRMASAMETPADGTKEEKNVSDIRYSLIAVLANHGFSEDVMAAARTAGATGGTVIHSRGLVDAEIAGNWGYTIQPEKEIILIVASAERKKNIMQSIAQSCGAGSPAAGLVLSVPVDGILGLTPMDEE